MCGLTSQVRAELSLQPNVSAIPMTKQRVQEDETSGKVGKDWLETNVDQLSSPSFLSGELKSETDSPTMSQVTSVSQLSDVQPTDWAFQALQFLVERYGCIAGYPNGTFRGNRGMTRYEFAAGLNACLNRVNELIDTATASLASREDLAKLQKLQEEFGAELATLRGRIDRLEARTAEIAANQFSTTTKLFGIAIVGVQGTFSNRGDINPRDGVKDTDDAATNINVVNLNQLLLTSQFSPRDYLVTGLIAGNGATGWGEQVNGEVNYDGLLAYEYPTNNSLVLSDLRYHRLLTDKFAIAIGSTTVNMTTTFRGPNRFENAATGSVSFASQRNPILNIGFTGQAGIAFDWQFAKRASLQGVYSSLNAGNPGLRAGLFDGNTTTAVQLLLTPTDTIDTSIYYVNNYSSGGCLLAFVGDDCLTAVNANTNRREPVQTNAIGATINWQLSPRFTLGAWGGYSNSYIPGKSGNVERTNWMVYMNFPDLFKKGNLGGIYIGQPPKITHSSLPVGNNIPDIINGGLGEAGGQPGTTTQIEAFYRFRVTDNMSITPGIIHIIEPGHSPNSDSITTGVLRTSIFF
ncbi:S-layer domain-containing protein [Calothrix sp. NIES-3974]|nr:S-layer domain-containing protein [Calothrix sp. NIES-3974]